MKFIIIIFAISSLYALGNTTDYIKDIELDLKSNNPNDIAIHSLLYQIGLKQKQENLLGSQACIQFEKERDSAGNVVSNRISIGVKADAFKPGSTDFSKDNIHTYNGLKKTVDSIYSFFENAGYNPKAYLIGSADGLTNPTSSYTSAESEKLGLFKGRQSYEIDTKSKRNNIELAYKRATAYVNNFIPEKYRSGVEIKANNSPNLEGDDNGKKPVNCPTRRTTVIALEFSPNIKLVNSMGELTPGFEVLTGEDNMKNTAIAALSAYDKELKDLPKYCQKPNGSSAKFIESSKQRVLKLKNKIENIDFKKLNKQLEEKFSFDESQIESSCQKKYNNLKQDTTAKRTYPNLEQDLIASCIKTRENLVNTFSSLKKPLSKNDISKVTLLLMTEKPSRQINHKLHVNSYNARKLLEQSKYANLTFEDSPLNNIINSEIQELGAAIKINNQDKNSSHFLDCFENTKFYDEELKNNSEKYIISSAQLNKLKNEKSGEIKLSLNKDNLETQRYDNGHGRSGTRLGYICSACGNGHYYDAKTKKMINDTREEEGSSYHTEAVSIQSIHENQSDPKNMFLVGRQKGLNLYVIPGCNLDSNFMKKNAKLVSMDDLESKSITLGDNDCIFKPAIVNSCVHSPTGKSKGHGSKAVVNSSMPSLLTGKNVKITAKTNVQNFEDIVELLKEDYKNHCPITFTQSDHDSLNDPAVLINNILCKNNKDISIPHIKNKNPKTCEDSVKPY